VADAMGSGGLGGPVDGQVGPLDTDPHVGHDPEVVASLLDGDLVGVDRAAAARQVAGCPRCAAVHRDLLALASATRELPTPARTIDFRLTTADAERLREPLASSARLTGDMQTTATHASHDAILVASLTDHDLTARERDAAEALVGACSLCAALHADLVALSAATRAMPTPARPRDFTLTRETAASLRPNGWRRWIAAFGTSRDLFSRPLAVGLTTLGLAGLLVATVPSVLQTQGATSSGSSERGVSTAPALGALPEAAADPTRPAVAGAAPSANAVAPIPGSLAPEQADPMVAAPVAPDGASPQPGADAAADRVAKGAGAESAPTNDAALDVAEQTVAEQTGAQNSLSVSPMILVSGALLLAGLGLFAIRRSARRLD